MNLNPPPNPAVFPDRKQVTAALERAAERARIIAEQTGTKLVVTSPYQTPNVADNNEKTIRSVNNEN
jgi:hypothetical protein